MNITLAAIGKLKAGPEQVLFAHYTARLKWKLSVKEFEIKKSLAAAERKEQEGGLLLAAIKDANHVIALDEKGKDLSSSLFAAHLRKQQDSGSRHIAFVIGGADGLHESVLKRAQLSLSFGRVTWPHMLMRGLLAEQLYRAQSILSGHPYHRE